MVTASFRIKNEVGDLRLNAGLIFLFAVIVCAISSCGRAPDEMKVKNSEFNIPVTIITYESRKFDFLWYDYKAVYGSPYGRRVYLFKIIQRDSLIKIQFSELEQAVILLRGFKNGDSAQACYFKWINSPPIAGGRVSPEIGRYTKYLETNIDSVTIKKMYPEIKCGITPRYYERIILDFRKPIPTLEFFRSIKFIE